MSFCVRCGHPCPESGVCPSCTPVPVVSETEASIKPDSTTKLKGTLGNRASEPRAVLRSSVSGGVSATPTPTGIGPKTSDPSSPSETGARPSPIATPRAETPRVPVVSRDLAPSAPTVIPPPSTTPVPKPSSDTGWVLLALLGGLLVIGGLIATYSIVNTQVGLDPYDTDGSGYVLPIRCGSRLEWVIGGGPAVPSSIVGMSAEDARVACHNSFDSDVDGWRLQLIGGVLAVVVGGAIGRAGMKRFKEE